ncbi:flagellar motor switch protein FliN [Polynucleobacter sp. 30F-ANTBAC]|jgi:flagellar motor switch protein FliN/FliY|uniref:flagellar motor switch protein FliN n=1 Tax=Polynucleobacter sp. 30F-ANTBAC TaxID=2689095 RepID=UPI001C0C3F80|nr:flagellar motor switch protein FliN [Polynucleobacter sp. 30F-ANTBAC]MBU3599764.1 flagellar motor switch protein FliN [Polynucleobacter sp. 30F-ANTBAC]
MMDNKNTLGGDDIATALTGNEAAVRRANFDNLDGSSANAMSGNDIDLVMDVPVQVTVELGRAKMQIRNLLALTYGSVIELDILAGEPLEVVVNGCLVAQGEVVIVNDRYGIRLTDIVTPAERLRKINR